MQSTAPTIEAYFASLPDDKRAVMEKLRALVEAHLPAASGKMKYGMPCYEHDDRSVAFNAQKHYFAFYADPEIVKRHRKALGDLDVGKCCIRFRKFEDLPLKTLQKIIADSVK
ncbi:MAG: hypothetical protein RIQ79_2159 [Verrucomicrobiota bacterium]|jgi:uncharacterized protein YdhG (YjbR/CyaY superfamily)